VTTQRLLELTFLGGSLGTAAELLLMAHTEGPWQKVPLALLAAGCLALVVAVVKPGHAARRVFLGLMLVFVTSGVAGAVLHFKSNVEFAKELDPDLSGGALLDESLTGATPALAPGTMILLAAVGWAWGRLDRRESLPERKPHF
jgi:ABC-type uncharacterized transport system permease subunit